MKIRIKKGKEFKSNNSKLETDKPTKLKISLKISAAEFDKAINTIKFNKKKLKNI